MASIIQNSRPGNRLDVERAVRSRYSQAAQQAEAKLCCPVEYDGKYLEVIPAEILQRDYGCGDPSKFLTPGEIVLDLGCGGGKICYIAAQIVGSAGKVFGVDCNDEMLSLAEKYRNSISDQLGYNNVEFRRGRIQDLQLDLTLLDRYLAENPVTTSADWQRLEEHARQLRETSPLIPDDSIDVVISNCVLNLVRTEDRSRLFEEMFRVLRRGGRVVVSDIVADEDVPSHLQEDARLWSGCISGAFREDRLLEAFEQTGFYGIEMVSRQAEPWAVVEGIEFHSATVRAFKGKQGPCLERKQAVIYNGPWKAVIDDDGHKLLRGKRMAVCDKTFSIYTRAPYASQITPVPPAESIPLGPPDHPPGGARRCPAPPFDCAPAAVRSPRETKGDTAPATKLPESNCQGPQGCC